MEKRHRSIKFLLAFVVMGTTFSAQSQVGPSVSSTLSFSELELEAKESWTGIQVGAEFLQTQYLSEPVDSRNQTNAYSYINPHFLYQSPRAKVDLRAVVSLNTEGDTHFYFPEVFYENYGIVAGRKTETWSELDSQFNFGLWQPLFRWDHTRPISMGLTGLFLKRELTPGLGVTLFASPIFLPDQQPDYKIQNGKVVSGNRWVRNPIDSIGFLKDSTSLKYTVIEPSVSEVIFRNSLAAKIRAGDSSGLWAQGSFAQKPKNQFHLGVDIYDTYDAGADEFFPRIHPVVVDQRLFTFEFGYKAALIETYFSFTQERFSDPDLPEGYEQTELTDNRYMGLVLEHEFFPSLPGEHRLIWSANQRTVMDEKDAKTRIEGEVSASTQRIAFQKWLGLEYQTAMSLSKGRALEFRAGYRHSPADAGQWVSIGSSLRWNKRLSLFASADVFGADTDAEGSERSFVSYYTNNDRVEGGFKYVF